MKHLTRFLPVVAMVLIGAAVNATAATVVTVPFKGPYQIEEMKARGIEIIAFTKHGVDVQADDTQLQWLLSRPYPVAVVRPNESGLGPAGTAVIDANLGEYHTYAELDTALSNLEAAYPAIAKRSIIGTSLEGRNIYALKISDNVTVDESEPEVLYMGNHHARELMSVEIPLRFAQYLLASYGVDSEITGYIDNREIWFVPMINPDGHYYVQQNHGGSSNSWWRKNRRDNGNGTFGVDLNRNYGYQWGYDNVGSSPSTSNETYRGTGPFSEPETQVVRDFVNSHDFIAWFSYHSYGELLLYPWGYIYGNTPDHGVFEALGDSLVEDNGYLAGNPASGAIYITNGDSDDWGYAEQVSKNKIFAFTPEVNSGAQGGFGPAESYIQPTFDLLRPMNIKLLKFAANPYQVVGPWTPVQAPTQAPYGNGITRVSWSPADINDPNPPVYYEVEGCLNPSFVTDTATPAHADWTFKGFSYTASGQSGGGYFSGNADGISNWMQTRRPFTVDASSDTLRFNITYNIETNWDYGYVEVSDNGGLSWTPIGGNITTNFNPYGNNKGNGFTGATPGWVQAVFPLTSYVGQEIVYRLAYVTDQAVTEVGFSVDNLTPVPTCESESILATGITETMFDHVPASEGLWRYRVRAVDAEDQASAWSSSRDRDVATLTAADTPRSYQTTLGANYPNPFNPSTQIPYVVGGADGSAPVRVELTIYAVTGARVASVFAGTHRPGAYTGRWSGSDERGQPVPSGIYFARLTVNGVPAATRKLVLLK
ncbi:MAG TPA: M14 family zinc carboxypeptidase [Candidatus Krumholzibacteria bacterium]|nr:M14 family zinc carboxypeptidase [Candidatus Krumholzibacteria bacterium]